MKRWIYIMMLFFGNCKGPVRNGKIRQSIGDGAKGFVVTTKSCSVSASQQEREHSIFTVISL